MTPVAYTVFAIGTLLTQRAFPPASVVRIYPEDAPVGKRIQLNDPVPLTSKV